jgi:DNA-binding SARP family transcriptional activator
MSEDIPFIREPSNVTLEFRCLGTFVFHGRGEWQSGPARARGGEFLEYFVNHPHAAVGRESLCDVLWPDGDTERCAHRLHLAASGARAAVRQECGALNPIVFADGTYSWNPAVHVERDTDRFERCFQDGSCGAYERGVASYLGEFLAGAMADWVVPLRVRYENMYVTMLVSAAGSILKATFETIGVAFDMNCGIPRATDYALKVVAADRAHERATQIAMVCLAKSGRRNLAIKEYYNLKRYLQKWLGVKPMGDTEEIRRMILDGRTESLQIS